MHSDQSTNARPNGSATIPPAANVCSGRAMANLPMSNWSAFASYTNFAKCYGRGPWIGFSFRSALDTGISAIYSTNLCVRWALEVLVSIWSKCSANCRRTKERRWLPGNCLHRCDRHRLRDTFVDFSWATAVDAPPSICSIWCISHRNCVSCDSSSCFCNTPWRVQDGVGAGGQSLLQFRLNCLTFDFAVNGNAQPTFFWQLHPIIWNVLAAPQSAIIQS